MLESGAGVHSALGRLAEPEDLPNRLRVLGDVVACGLELALDDVEDAHLAPATGEHRREVASESTGAEDGYGSNSDVGRRFAGHGQFPLGGARCREVGNSRLRRTLEPEHVPRLVGQRDLQGQLSQDPADLRDLVGVGLRQLALREIDAVLEADTHAPARIADMVTSDVWWRPAPRTDQ